MSQHDCDKLVEALMMAQKARDDGTKFKVELTLTVGKATVYTMGNNNPVIRVDFKLEK